MNKEEELKLGDTPLAKIWRVCRDGTDMERVDDILKECFNEGKLKGRQDKAKENIEIVKKWEKENTEVLGTEDIINGKVIIADYIKWEKVRELIKHLKEAGA